MNTSNKNIFITIVVIVILLAAGWLLVGKPTQTQTISSQVIWHNATSDLIVLSGPQPGQTVGKQFHATGAARGNWYFEASFPVSVVDKNGKVLVEKPAQALSDWMTTDFVQFDVAFDVGSYVGPATLILKKDNPSGDASKDSSVEIPVIIQ